MESLVVVKQLPVIEEQLHTLKERWEQLALYAAEMVCTEDTIQAVKAFRANMRKDFDDVETLRKQAKNAVMEPYEQFEAVYKECVTTAFKKADETCALKIGGVEADMKRRCEDGLRDYFAELCAVRHLEWLEYERAGVKVDMASAKAKTPKKLRVQLAEFVSDVDHDISTLSEMEDAEELLAEYRLCLNMGQAIGTVLERHRRIEEQRAQQEARVAAKARESEGARRVETLAPPVVVPELETVKCTFTVRTTMDKLKKLKEFLNMEGIQYE